MIEFSYGLIPNAISLTDLDKGITGFDAMIDVLSLNSLRCERSGWRLHVTQRIGLLVLLLTTARQPECGGCRYRGEFVHKKPLPCCARLPAHVA
jgi:hypothetical protein